jgi:fimbrial chaperone protein
MNEMTLPTLGRKAPPTFGGATELLVLTAALVAPATFASSLDVQPVRLELASADDVGAVTFRNQGSSALLIQARPTAWSQVDGKSDFVATDELIVSPPIFNLQPGADQVVRVGVRGALGRSSERAYRIFFTELPGRPAAETANLRVNLSLAIPVFLAPEQRAPAPLEWSLTALEGGRVELGLHNAGNEHVQVKQVILKEAFSNRELGAGTALGYVLAGGERRWTIAADVDVDTWTASPQGFILSTLTDRLPSVSEWPLRAP